MTWLAAMVALFVAGVVVVAAPGAPVRWSASLVGVAAAGYALARWWQARATSELAGSSWDGLVEAVDAAEGEASGPVAARLRRLRGELERHDGTAATWDRLAVREEIRRLVEDPMLSPDDRRSLAGVRRSIRATGALDPAGRGAGRAPAITIAGVAAVTSLVAVTLAALIPLDPDDTSDGMDVAAASTSVPAPTGVTIEVAPIVVEAEITSDDLEIPIVVRTPVTDATGWHTVPAPAFRSSASDTTTVPGATTSSVLGADSTTATAVEDGAAAFVATPSPAPIDPLAIPEVDDRELDECVGFHSSVAGLVETFGVLSPSVIASPWFVERARACGDPTWLVDGVVAVGG